MRRYALFELKKALIKILKINNVSDEQSEILADTMLEADMRGIHTHGVSVFPAYIKKVQSNGLNLKTDSIVLQQTEAFAIVDANNQFGMVSAYRCMSLAIEKAKTSGIYTVFCRNANTFGAAFKYAKMAIEKKMIGMCMSNSPSAMPAWGGNKKILGTNPFAIGIPADKEGPILIDMATSIVAKSKINEARKEGKAIPFGWAVDENGLPTTDPIEAIKGMVLPMAEHKGYAIAMAIDILAGVLSGAGYLNNINKFYSGSNECMNVGHCFIAINPTLIFGEDFYTTIDKYILEVKESGNDVCYPGENGNKKCALCKNGSVELTDETVNELTMLFETNDIKGALIEYGG